MAYTAYASEEAFAAYLHRALNRGGFAAALGWSVPGDDYDDAVNEALALVGASDITAITSTSAIRQLNAAGKVALWRQVMEATTHFRDNRTNDGSSAQMSQIHAHAKAMLREAEAEAVTLGVALTQQTVSTTQVAYTSDPYATLADTDGSEF